MRQLVLSLLCLAAAIAADSTGQVPFTSVLGVECTLSRKYTSSPVEDTWVREIDVLADSTREWTRGCARMRSMEEEVKAIMTHYSERESWAKLSDL